MVPPIPPPTPAPTSLCRSLVPALVFFNAPNTSIPANNVLIPGAPLPKNFPVPPINRPMPLPAILEPIPPILVKTPAPPSDVLPNHVEPFIMVLPMIPFIPPFSAIAAPFKNVLSIAAPNPELANFVPKVNFPVPETTRPFL